jgi:hypothetical protein
VRFMAIST